MKVALVHDFLNQFGGSERVLDFFQEIFPEAPVYTLLYNDEKLGNVFNTEKIKTSSLQKKKFFSKHYKYLLPFFPKAVEEFDLQDFDIVLSSSSNYAKGIITKPESAHICYCHAPSRYLWDWNKEYLAEQKLSKVKKILVLPILSYLRLWDRAAAERVDYWIANSENTRKRIKKYYQKDSTVINPPVDVSRFKIAEKTEDYFLIVSRLSPYKRIDLAIEAFNKNKLPLVVAGEGSQKQELEKIAGANIKFLGKVSDEQLVELYSKARAFVFPTWDEDFGLTPLEAMASGRPVIAAGKGGTRETVTEKTGVFFNEPTAESLLQAIEQFILKEPTFEPLEIRQHAEKFNVKVFKEKINEFVSEKAKEHWGIYGKN